MKDLRRALQRRSERGDPIGSDRLRQRVAFELAGGHMRPEDTRRRIPGPMMVAAAAAVVLIAVGGVMLLGGEDEPVVTAPAVTTVPITTTLPPSPSIGWSDLPLPEGAWVHAIVEADPGLVATGCEIETIEQTNLYGDRYLEVHYHAAIWTSRDGRAWTQQLTDEDARAGAGCVEDVARTATGLVGVATTDAVAGVAWLSDDGITWERVDPDTMQDAIVAVVEAGPDGTLVAGGWIGLEARVWTSMDGRAWTPIVDSDLAGRSVINDLATSDRGFVMVGVDRSSEYYNRPAVWTSSDGTRWNRVPITQFESADPLGAVEGLATVQALPGGMWLVGDLNSRAWISSDGTNWDLVYEPDVVGDFIPSAKWVHSGDRWVAILDGVWISLDDGATWYEDDSSWIPAGMLVDGLFAFGDGFIAVGSVELQDPSENPEKTAWIGTWDD
jgi:hypothetical protein